MYLNGRVLKQTRNKRRSNEIANVLIIYLEAESENVSLAQLRLDMCLTICLENGVLPSVMKTKTQTRIPILLHMRSKESE